MWLPEVFALAVLNSSPQQELGAAVKAGGWGLGDRELTANSGCLISWPVVWPEIYFY